MSFIDCVLKAQKDGKISKASADFIQNNFNGENKMEVVESLRGNIKRDKYLKALQSVKENELSTLITSKEDSVKALGALLTKDKFGAAGYSNIEYRGRAIQGVLDSEFGEAMEAMRTKVFGLKSDAKLNDDIVRALYNEEATQAAVKFAKQWDDVSEHARQWFNKSGGDIAKLKDWRLPQGHNARKIRKAGFEEWKKSILPKLSDDIKTDNMEKALRDTYDTIVSQGLNKLEPGKIPKGITSNVAQKGQDHRFIKFKDSTSYLEYQKEFGNPDVFATMSDHLRHMSQEISKLEILGPNPEKTYRYLKDVARKQKQGEGLGKLKEGYLDATYNAATGIVDNNDIVNSADFWVAASMGGFRALNTGAKLGSAAISSITDLSSSLVTAGYNNMAYKNILGRQMSTLLDEIKTSGSSENIKLGVRLGLVADAWNSTLANSRFAEATSGKLQHLTEVVLRASGINAWTEAGRKAFGMEFTANMAENFNKSFKDFPLKEAFERYGITETDWNKIKKSTPLEVEGSKFFDIQDMFKRDKELGLKVMEMIQSETDYAVLVPDASVRAITTGGKPKGSISGELARSMTQFKSFPITFMMAHMGRVLSMNKGDGLQYGAKLFVASTVLGGLAIEIKDFTKGKTSRVAATDEKNWEKYVTDSMLQGGGLGIFGDFFFQDQSRYGNSMVTTLAGPLGTLTEDVYNVSAGNFHQLARGEDANIGSDIVRMGKNYLPAQNLWYTRLLFDRMVFDVIKSASDPKYNKKIRQQKRRMKKDTGQDWRIAPSKL